MAHRSFLVLLLLLLVGIAVGDSVAQQGELPPQQRYDLARQAMQQGRYEEAESGFRQVFESDRAGTELRALALFSVGLMQQNRRFYAEALATFQKVSREFPDSAAARRATDAAGKLTEGDGEAGLRFQSGFDEMMDAFTRAREQRASLGEWAIWADLERGLAVADRLLTEFPNHPRAKVVAFQGGEIAVAMRRFAVAQQHYRKGLDLAEKAPKNEDLLDSFVENSKKQLEEAVLLQQRWWITLVSQLILAGLAILLIAQRPWIGFDPSLAVVAGWAIVALAVWAGLGATGAWAVREYIDDHSPVSEEAAVWLVFLPGVVGVLTGLGFLAGFRRSDRWRGPWGGRAAASLGALAASATAVCVVNVFGLFRYLDSVL